MEEPPHKNVDDSSKENEEKISRTSSSSSDYELVENMEKITPVLEDIVSEDYIKDALNSAMINSPSTNVVGKSIFYDRMDEKSKELETDTDEDAPTYEIDPDYRNDGNFTIFSNVVYLGSATLQSPKSVSEITQHISELNTAVKHEGVKVKISIPNCADGQIILYHEDTDILYSTFDINSILYYGRGTKECQECFAFSSSHGNSHETTVYQCHIFRCNIPEAVNPVSQSFSKAFKKAPDSSMACSITSENFALNSIVSDMSGLTSAMYEFLVSLEIREKISKSSYTNVLREKSVFKIHQNCDKEIYITVKQNTAADNLPCLFVERCFGVLLSIGKIKKQADMSLLELQTSGNYLKGSPDFQIIAKWNLNEKPFEILNESQKTHLITIAVDLVIKGILEPVRFVIETHMKIDNSDMQSSRFSNSFLFTQGNKRPLVKKFYIQLKQDNKDNTWILDSIDPSDEILEPTQSTSFNQKIKNISKMVRSTSATSFDYDLSLDEITPTDDEEDEPLVSGTGQVNKELPQDKLDLWYPVLSEWNTSGKRPKNLQTLIRSGGGIPQALRCQLWQKLAKTDESTDLSDLYRVLITKESKCEDIILRDVHRTFPAHELFKEKSGFGQDALYKLSRAYSVYDTEIGYCQGLSFIAATLLLNMPEEESFQVLVAIMYNYNFRELYKQNFENLSLRLFQLTCLMRDQLPDLYEHFVNQKLEVHMFASQWFLTLFTARFALPFVFQCIDLFLLDGINVLFQIAISLLTVCKKDLLSKDFESILKYIRVHIPKKFRTEQQVSRLIKLASECKVKKLKKYEEEYLVQKEDNDRFEKMLSQHQAKYQEDRKSMKNEILQLQKRIDKFECDEKKYESIINDYKQIIHRQEQQIEELMKNTKVHDNSKTSHNKEDDNDVFSLKQRIKELEIELISTKVAQVEAESKLITQNQNIKQQVMNISNPKPPLQSVTSWKSKLENVVNSMNIPNMSMNIPTFQSHLPDLATFSTPLEDPPK